MARMSRKELQKKVELLEKMVNVFCDNAQHKP